MWKQRQTIFLGSKITVDGDCGQEIKRQLPFGRRAMTNLDSVFKSTDNTLPTKVHLVKAIIFLVVIYEYESWCIEGWAIIFPVVIYKYESWIIKKAECRRTDAFKLWCWRRFLRVLWTAKWSKLLILKEINTEYSLEGLILKQKLNTLATWCEELTHWKRSWCWERLRAGGRGDDRGWNGWMALLTQWTWVWASFSRCAAVHGVTKSWTQLGDWTTTNNVF